MDYSDNLIMEGTDIVSYNYNKRAPAIFNNLRQKFPNMSKQWLREETFEAFKADTGMISNFTINSLWTLDGYYIGTISSELALLFNTNDNEPVDANSGPYHIGNYIFYKYYEEYFQPKFNSKDLY